jgi:hypothetical protein
VSRPYAITWEGEVHADNPVEAAQLALDSLRNVSFTPKFEVDGREIDLDDPPLCSVQIFGGSRIDPPEFCDGDVTHWDDDDNGYCDKHSAQPDPFDGEDI